MTDFLRRLHPDHLHIARAGLWLLLFVMAAKLAGAAKEMAIAWRFGRGHEVDAYQLAFTLSTWVPATVITVMAAVLVPAIVRVACEPAAQRNRFHRELNGVAVLAGVVLAAATWVVAPALVSLFASGLPEQTEAISVDTLRRFAPLAFLTVVGGVLAARMQALQDHRYTVAEGLPSLTIVLLLLLWQTNEMSPLVVGTLLGFLWQVLSLYRWSPDRKASSGLSLHLASQQWRGIWRAGAIMGAGQFAMSFTLPLDQWFAAAFGTGAIATLGYANRIIWLGMSLGGAVIARATLPIFAGAVHGGEAERVRRHALWWGGLMLLVGAVFALPVWTLATPIVRLLFERGAFAVQDTAAVAEALRWGILQVPPYLASLVLLSEVTARGHYGLIAAITFANLVCKAIGNWLLGDIFGLNGVLLASAVMYLFSMLMFLYVVVGPGRAGVARTV